jgi:hypothetical protein
MSTELTPRDSLEPKMYFPEPAKITADQQTLFLRSVSPMDQDKKKIGMLEVLDSLKIDF